MSTEQASPDRLTTSDQRRQWRADANCVLGARDWPQSARDDAARILLLLDEVRTLELNYEATNAALLRLRAETHRCGVCALPIDDHATADIELCLLRAKGATNV